MKKDMEAKLIIYPPDSHDIEQIYISDDGDIETGASIGISKSPGDDYVLVMPHVKSCGFFVLNRVDRIALARWLLKGVE